MKRAALLLATAALLCLAPLADSKSASRPQGHRRVQDDHPCPATGRSKGPCKGYVIDHITPLACGGADRPSNMQWQTTAEAKAKEKWERKACRK